MDGLKRVVGAVGRMDERMGLVLGLIWSWADTVFLCRTESRVRLSTSLRSVLLKLRLRRKYTLDEVG